MSKMIIRRTYTPVSEYRIIVRKLTNIEYTNEFSSTLDSAINQFEWWECVSSSLKEAYLQVKENGRWREIARLVETPA